MLLKKHKTPLKIAALIVLCLLLALCLRVGGGGNASAPIVYPTLPASPEEMQSRFAYLIPTALDREEQVSPTARVIDLSAVNGDLLLTEGGDYRLTGELKGCIRINTPEENVHLFLDGVNVRSVFGPALFCENADKVIVTLLPGTENAFADSGHYEADSDAEACVYCACDLTLNGAGNLSVNALYKDAVRAKDRLRLLGEGEYNIRCKRTALHGNDGIYAEDGIYYLSSEKYGLKTTKKGTDGRGTLILAGGSWNILAGRYAFVTTMADLYVYNCNVRQNAVIAAYDAGGRAVIDPACMP